MNESTPKNENERLLADAIRRQRRQAGLSQSALARSISVTEQSIYSWERGLHEPNTKHFQELVSVLGDLPAPLRTTYESRQFQLSDLLMAELAERVAAVLVKERSTTA